VSRIGLNDALHEYVEAGLTAAAAVADIYQQASRDDDERFDLYCNGKRLSRDYILELEFKLGGGNAIVVIAPIGVGRGRVDHVYRFELDADQVKARIAKLTASPKRKRGQSKPKPGTRKSWVFDRLRELVKDGDEKATTKILRGYQRKFGKILDPQKRDNLRRNIDRWRDDVEKKIAAEKTAARISDN
jgi:hypothetical protein